MKKKSASMKKREKEDKKELKAVKKKVVKKIRGREVARNNMVTEN